MRITKHIQTLALSALLTLILFPTLTVAATNFEQKLWYSTDNLLADEPVRIYVAIQNHNDSDMTGVVNFYIDEQKLTSTEVRALAGSQVEAWADWTPLAGTSTIKAVLTQASLAPIGAEITPIETDSAGTAAEVFVDTDTDGDGVGNLKDTDDDNDGVNDEDEIASGTDPLVADQSAVTDNNATTTEASASEDPTNSRAGLEQYLADGSTRLALAGVTEAINHTKQQLDEYRDFRQQKQSANHAATSSTTEAYDQDGFGSVSRDSASKNSGWLSTITKVLGSVLNTLYTLVLFILSGYLAHPALVQFSLLLLILYLFYKLARRLGSRPQ